MIESEENRIRLTEMLERWAKHTKADQMLRENDIPGLVHQILERFYHIHLCCGHMVREFDEGYDFTYKEMAFDDDNFCDDDVCNHHAWADVSGNYCKDCYERMKEQYDEEGYPKDSEWTKGDNPIYVGEEKNGSV